MSYQELVQAHLRLVILRVLATAPGYEMPSNLLHTAVSVQAPKPSRDQLQTELHWLAEQGLVSVKPAPVGVKATLTARGADVAEGLATVPGVRRPEPGE